MTEKNEAIRLLEKIVNGECLSDSKVNILLKAIEILKTPASRKKSVK